MANSPGQEGARETVGVRVNVRQMVNTHAGHVIVELGQGLKSLTRFYHHVTRVFGSGNRRRSDYQRR